MKASFAAFLVVTVTLLASPALAQNGAQVTAQGWLRELEPADVYDVYPPLPLAQRISGQVSLMCVIAAEGNHACELESETPAGFGFGAAALRLSQTFAFSPRREAGVAVDSAARVPVLFEAPAAPPPPVLNAPLLTGAAPPAMDVSGRALLACAARLNGQLECAVEQENAEGLGQAALDLIRARNGGPVAGDTFRTGARIAFDFPAAPQRPDPTLWVRRPGPSDFAAAYPDRALQRGVSGRAELECMILETRRLDCAVAREEPANMGFGAAALRLAARYEAGEAARTGERVSVPFSFRVGD